MVVLDGFDTDCCHRRPVHATIVLPRHGIVVWHEDDAIAVVNADGERARSVSLQLFAPRTGRTACRRECLRHGSGLSALVSECRNVREVFALPHAQAKSTRSVSRAMSQP